jgi:hypothetical protein
MITAGSDHDEGLSFWAVRLILAISAGRLTTAEASMKFPRQAGIWRGRLGSLKVGDVRAWILPLGRGALLTWRTQVDEAKHVLLGREPHGGTALWGA